MNIVLENKEIFDNNKIKRIELQNVKDFELRDIFECGQCFRWKKEEDGSYTGVIQDGAINVNKIDNNVIIQGNLSGDFEEICRNYFDLERDYSYIKNIISTDDENMKKAISYGKGIRILNQDPWEMLISYIISAANNIPRISKTIETLSEKYGKKITMNENTYYMFPTPNELKKATMEELRECNLGFRDKYVYNATRMVVNGEINFEELRNSEYNVAKKKLMQIPGVGAKVADCILLFSLGKIEAFPVDTWIKKVMNELYVDSTNITKINQYATEKFGKYAGIAQQYLFYYKREN
ncbi:MAG: 8-oxoguanine DNA glycosylase [Clostridia bacterium]|nr:8-oxoguanine DNA glycosylase [Clostridia bacterium]